MDLSPIQPFLDWLADHQQWVAVSIAAIAFLESLAIAGIVIPGVLLLFGACAVAGSGTLGVWVALASALAGAILGDCISFFLGKTLKDHIRDLWPFRNYPQWLDNGEKFFNRHGGKSIMIGRFVGPIRPVLPMVAGMLDMSSIRFVSINFISALGWAPLYVLPGYLFGASLKQDINLPEGIGNLGWLLLGICVALFLFVRLTHWHLHPDSRLYRAFHNWIDRQHNVRIFWHWLAEHRGGRPAFPILSASLLIASLAAFSLVWLPTPNTGFIGTLNLSTQSYFSNLQHPLLDNVFIFSLRLADSGCLIFFSAPLICWLLLKRHFAAGLHFITALIAIITISTLATGICNETAGVTLVSGLLATFIAQEIEHHKRWWIYCFTLLPMILISISSLYQGKSLLSEVLAGIFMGLIICGATRVSFSRYNRHAIKADFALAICSLVAMGSAILYIAYSG
jgi:membrane protein DedA with SNARE-associated domain